MSKFRPAKRLGSTRGTIKVIGSPVDPTNHVGLNSLNSTYINKIEQFI
jgi:hypothetical protein